MPKLFVSHASEDKDAFARPLADALIKETYDVWFDEYVLRVGDRLREKIDEGLRTSDFGIVILSKAFFAKKWPTDELEGLFALERKNKKLILPVWLDVTKEEVEQYSPILAGRLAANAARGLAVVVEELKNAISASDRTREVATPKRGLSALLSLSHRMSNEEKEKKWLFSPAGVAGVKSAADELTATFTSYIEEAEKQGLKKRFSHRKSVGDSLIVDGPNGVFFQTDLSNMPFNSASGAEYLVAFGKLGNRDYPPNNEPARVLREINFKPRLDEDDAVKWDEKAGEGKMLSSTQVADYVFEKFVEYIDQFTKRN